MRVFAVVRGDIDEYRTTSIHPSSIMAGALSLASVVGYLPMLSFKSASMRI